MSGKTSSRRGRSSFNLRKYETARSVTMTADQLSKIRRLDRERSNGFELVGAGHVQVLGGDLDALNRLAAGGIAAR